MPCNAAFDEDGFHLSRCSVKEEKGGKGTLGWGTMEWKRKHIRFAFWGAKKSRAVPG